jgi:hypothetical protein
VYNVHIRKQKLARKKGELQMQNPLGLFILGIHGIWRVAWNDANFFMEQTDAKYFPQRLEWLSGMLCFAEAIKNFLNWEELVHSGWNKMMGLSIKYYLNWEW